MRRRDTFQGAAPVLFGAATLFSMVFSGPASAAIGVDVNGQPVQFRDARPVQINGRVFIPLRDVAETLGADVRWDPASRTVTGTRESRSFTLPLGSHRAYVMGSAVHLDAPARIMGGRTVVPLRFVAEALGAEVAWHPADQRVAVNLPGATAGGDVVAGERETRVVVPGNTVVRVALDDEISSERARVGDRFTATLDESDGSRFPRGTRFEGQVTQVRAATKEAPGVIDMAFDRAILPDGGTVAISGSLASLDQEHVQRTADGRLVSRSKRAGKKFDWKWVGIGAAGGAVLGEVFGDDLLKGALLGGVGGAIYGYLNKNKGKDEYRNVELSRGTEFGIHLHRQVAFAER